MYQENQNREIKKSNSKITGRIKNPITIQLNKNKQKLKCSLKKYCAKVY